MTALALAPEARPLPVPLVLGLQEGWRIVRHPIALVGGLIAAILVGVVGDNSPRDAFEVPLIGPNMYYGVFVFFSANLVASRDRRAHTGELLAATAVPATGRVAGLCLGAIVPAALCGLFVYGVHLTSAARGLYVEAPSTWHLLQAPITVLGGALLGIMVARLSGVPGTALVVMVAMIAYDVWLSSSGQRAELFGTFRTWAVWGETGQWHGVYPGSAFWHDVYLLCLCAMAATGAFLREARSTWRVLWIGAGCTAAAVAASLLQLP